MSFAIPPSLMYRSAAPALRFSASKPAEEQVENPYKQMSVYELYTAGGQVAAGIKSSDEAPQILEALVDRTGQWRTGNRKPPEKGDLNGIDVYFKEPNNLMQALLFLLARGDEPMQRAIINEITLCAAPGSHRLMILPASDTLRSKPVEELSRELGLLH
jgi:hypothetical protein